MPKDLQVFSSDSDQITFTSGDNPVLVEGMTSLIQEVLIELLSDFNEQLGSGSGLPSILRESLGDDDITTRSAIVGAINNVTTHILLNQRSRPRLKLNQALDTIVVNSVEYGGDTWFIRITVFNLAGESADLTI